MAFRGAFIGVDRYRSPHINELTCAARDAKALHALFSDALGGSPDLLIDDDATRDAIHSQFERLAACDKDDDVVVAFSGHGAPSHHLVSHDSDPFDLDASAIHLDDLTELFRQIPARRLVCVLDCCFSGGMGAKVLQLESVSRDLRSTEGLLEQMSGVGRLILTASGSTEPAYENSRLQHGLLTYVLLEALQGADEVRESGQLSVFSLLQYVTRRVIDESTKLAGKAQHPALRGSIDKELFWPVMKPGPCYLAAFPSRARPQARSEIRSLAPYGFPDNLLDAWASSIPSLNQLQIDAINSYGVLDDRHLLVSAPTSSGKTMVGELAALKAVLERRRALFLLPLKALVRDKSREFSKKYGGFGVRIIEATGETDDVTPLIRGRYDICLLTYEKFAAVAVSCPHILEQVGTIVVDEVQMVADESRGANLEFVLTLLRQVRGRGVEPQIVALSAVIGETNGFERWLGARLLRRSERSVPLDEGLLLADGSFRFLDADTRAETTDSQHVQPQWGDGNRSYVIPLVRKLVEEGKRVIVFRETRGEARACARYLSQSLGLSAADDVIADLPVGDPSAASTQLRDSLQAGVAFHISDLDADERRCIEEHFRRPNSSLRVISATTTLAMGVNTPAEAVVIVGLEHPGQKPYSVAEYKNLAGRAGRLGYSERGVSYLLAIGRHEEHSAWNRYVVAEPEDLRSRFVDADPASLLVRVLAAMQTYSPDGVPVDDLVGFLESSFGAFQRSLQRDRWEWDRSQLLTALNELERHGLVQRKDDETCQLAPLGRLAGEAGIEVRSIVRLVDCLRAVAPDQISDPTLLAAAQLTAELDQVYFPLNKRSKVKEPQSWFSELANQNIPRSVLNSLRRSVADDHQGTMRAKRAVACLHFITLRSMADIEAVLARHGGARGGMAGAVRSAADRTCDLLPAAARVAEILHPGLDLDARVSRLAARLQVGVPGDAAEVAATAGTALSRADYHRLVERTLSSPDAISRTADGPLLDCLGQDAEKLATLREAVRAILRKKPQEQTEVTLAPYEP